MTMIQPANLLKVALLADAAACGGTAALQLILPSLLSSELALPAPLLTSTGLFLALYAASLVILANCRTLWKPLVYVIVLGNVGWALATIDLVVFGMIAPNGLGLVYLAVQSLTVVALAAFEFAGLKASRVVMETNAKHAI